MKKIIFLLALIITVAFTACNKAESPDVPQPTTPAAIQYKGFDVVTITVQLYSHTKPVAFIGEVQGEKFTYILNDTTPFIKTFYAPRKNIGYFNALLTCSESFRVGVWVTINNKPFYGHGTANDICSTFEYPIKSEYPCNY